MSDFEYLPFRDELEADTLRLMDKVQGVTTTKEEFAWWFGANPGGERNLVLARLDGAVVGCNSFTPYRMTFAGREETVGFPQKICVDDVCRGKGVFLKMQKRLEDAGAPRGVRLLLGFPNANAYPIWTGKWSCLDLPALRLWLRVENPAAVLARGKVPRPVGAVIGAPYRLALALGRKPRARGGLSLAPIERFDGGVDALWSRFLPSLPATTGMIVRSHGYLNWRYLDAPAARYRALGLARGDELVGYAVVGLVEKWGLRLGTLCDLMVEPGGGERSARALLLDAAIHELRGQGADAIAALQPATGGEVAQLAARLFVPTPRRFPVIAKVLDGAPGRDAELLRPGSLRFTLGDLDFF
jgi:hypothetical protein